VLTTCGDLGSISSPILPKKRKEKSCVSPKRYYATAARRESVWLCPLYIKTKAVTRHKQRYI
jgi:hypothetical protein